MKFEIYFDKKRFFRWRLKARNGLIVADCAEGYSSKGKCEKGINLVLNCDSAQIVDQTENPKKKK